MNTKSKIQIQAELSEYRYHLMRNIQRLMEEYDMDGVVLNQGLYQVTSGYMTKNKEYGSLQEAIQDIKPGDLLLFENDKIILGNHYKSIVNTPEGLPVFEIHC